MKATDKSKLKASHKKREKELKKACKQMDPIIHKNSYAVPPDMIVKYIMYKDDVLEKYKDRTLIIYQQDLLLGISSIRCDEWDSEFGFRLTKLIRNILIMPSQMKDLTQKDIDSVRQLVGLKK